MKVGNQISGTAAEVNSRRALIVAGLLALLFLGGTLLAPLMESRETRGAALVRAVYAPLCHQSAGRSLALFERPQAVCARCSGLYLGGAVGLLLAAGVGGRGRRRLRPWQLLLAALPTAIDAVLPWVGLQGLANTPRLLISIPAGVLAGLFLAIGIADLFRVRNPFHLRRRIRGDVSPEVADV